MKNCTKYLILFFLFTNLSLNSQEKKTLAIYPFEKSFDVKQNWVSIFTDELEANIISLGKFRMVTRTEIEKVIKEQDFQVNCSATLCAIKLGKFISADIIVGSIRKLDNDYHITIKIIETESGEIFHSSTKTVPINNNFIKIVSKEFAVELANILRESALLDFDVKPFNSNIFLDGELIGNTSHNQIEVSPGLHVIRIENSGYETWEQTFNFYENQDYSLPINKLNRKSRFTSLKKSLLFPGFGQFYQADENHSSRKSLGIFFRNSTILSLLLNGFFINNYFDAKNDYENANKVYLSQTDLESVNTHREIAQEFHSKMVNAGEKVTITSGLILGLWGVNIIDAFINFPDYNIKVTSSYSQFDNTSSLVLGVRW